MNILCTICSDLVNQAENIYVTKCGHIFHHHCLMQWIERSKTCPQCRHKVTDRCMFRLYPTISNENSGEDAATLQNRLDDAQLQLRQQRAKFKEKEDKLAEISAELNKNCELTKSYEKKLVSYDSRLQALREQLEYANIQNKETQKLKEENSSLKKNIQMLNGLQKVLNATSSDVELMLQGYSDSRTIATFATALKKALTESESKRNEMRDRLNATKQRFGLEKKNVADLQAKVIQLEDEIIQMKNNHEIMKANNRMDELRKELTGPTEPMSVPISNYPEHDLNEAIIVTDTPERSFGTMVKNIEASDSPYLSLKQSSILPLTALQRQPVTFNMLKPSEMFQRKGKARPGAENKPSTSIFHTKETIKFGSFNDSDSSSNMDLSYDGLGGHSKLDVFPKPKATTKSCIPKLTAKHKLKRPSGTQDIGNVLKRLKDK